METPRRCETNVVGLFGECLACGADQGEVCQKKPVAELRAIMTRRQRLAQAERHAQAAWENAWWHS